MCALSSVLEHKTSNTALYIATKITTRCRESPFPYRSFRDSPTKNRFRKMRHFFMGDFIFMSMQINEGFSVGDIIWDRRHQRSYRITRLSGSVAYGKTNGGKEIAGHVTELIPYSEYEANPEAAHKSLGRPNASFDSTITLADYQPIYKRLFHRRLKEMVSQLLKDNRTKVVELKKRCREEAMEIARERLQK